MLSHKRIILAQPLEPTETSIIGRLLQHLQGRNPVAFSLPPTILKGIDCAGCSFLLYPFCIATSKMLLLDPDGQDYGTRPGEGYLNFDELSDSERGLRQGKRKRVRNDRFCYACSLGGPIEDLAHCARFLQFSFSFHLLSESVSGLGSYQVSPLLPLVVP